MIEITESGRYETTILRIYPIGRDARLIWKLWKDDKCLYMRYVEVERNGY